MGTCLNLWWFKFIHMNQVPSFGQDFQRVLFVLFHHQTLRNDVHDLLVEQDVPVSSLGLGTIALFKLKLVVAVPPGYSVRFWDFLVYLGLVLENFAHWLEVFLNIGFSLADGFLEVGNVMFYELEDVLDVDFLRQLLLNALNWLGQQLKSNWLKWLRLIVIFVIIFFLVLIMNLIIMALHQFGFITFGDCLFGWFPPIWRHLERIDSLGLNFVNVLYST